MPAELFLYHLEALVTLARSVHPSEAVIGDVLFLECLHLLARMFLEKRSFLGGEEQMLDSFPSYTSFPKNELLP